MVTIRTPKFSRSASERDPFDWGEFFGILGGVLFYLVFGSILLSVVGEVVWLTWTSGFGFILLIIIGFVAIAAVIAGILTWMDR